MSENEARCSCHACRDAVPGEPAPLCAVANELVDALVVALPDVDAATAHRVVLDLVARHGVPAVRLAVDVVGGLGLRGRP